MKISSRFSLPYISLHQSLKELSINEMISEMDALIANPVLAVISELPENPEEAALYIINSQVENKLADKRNFLALWINNHWKFINPSQNMVFYSLEHSKNIIFRNGSWNF